MGKERPSILVVDDAPSIITLIKAYVEPDYQVVAASHGEMALQLLSDGYKPDLILLDVMMPHMSGYEIIERVRNNSETEDIPVIFVTALANSNDEEYGLGIGAADYIVKPIRKNALMARIKNQILASEAKNVLKEQNVRLESLVRARTRELMETQEATILSLSNLAETRDSETGNHILRTQHYVRALALALRNQKGFSHVLTNDNIETIFKSAPLHDIGKVGVPDSILLKPGKLDSDEWVTMRQHTDYGRDAILAAERMLSTESSFLTFAKEIAYGHHEKWDGTGYPEGLKGDDIPVSARLMAVADVYDALISRRVYKSAFTHEKAVEIIKADRGTHFDPDVVDAFLALSENFRAIAEYYDDRKDAGQRDDLVGDTGVGT